MPWHSYQVPHKPLPGLKFMPCRHHDITNSSVLTIYEKRG